MKKLITTTVFSDILNSPVSFYTGIATFLSIIFVRLSIEMWINRFSPESLQFFFYETLHTTLFFYLLFVICVGLTTKIARISLQKTIIIYLFGFLMIILPPILDWIISSLYFNDVPFRSYYLFDSVNGLRESFFTFFGDRPRDGITYGTRIMIGLTFISHDDANTTQHSQYFANHFYRKHCLCNLFYSQRFPINYHIFIFRATF